MLYHFVLDSPCYTILEPAWPGEGYSNTKTSTNNSRKDLGEMDEPVQSNRGDLWPVSNAPISKQLGFYAVNAGARNKTKKQILFVCLFVVGPKTTINRELILKLG